MRDSTGWIRLEPGIKKIPPLTQTLDVNLQDRWICVGVDKTELTLDWCCSTQGSSLSQLNDEERIVSRFGGMEPFVPAPVRQVLKAISGTSY